MEQIARTILRKANQGKPAPGGCRLRTSSSRLFPKLAAQRADGEDAFFVYTPADTTAAGFVIVSGDQSRPAVLGYSASSRWNTDSLAPGFRYWLGTYCKGGVAGHGSFRAADLKDVNPEGVAPLLGEVRWGQGKPFNDQCPTFGGQRCVTGCVATAMAQVMKFHEYPNRGQGTVYYKTRTNEITVARNLPAYSIKWDKMRPEYNEFYSEEEAKAVASLMFSCGATVEMDYGLEASGALASKLVPAYVDNFGYDSDMSYVMRDYFTEDEWHELLLKELNERRPVNYGGVDPDAGGHEFVVDGYEVFSLSDQNYLLYHFNWGWQGANDGYFLLSGIDFSEGQDMVLGVKPEDNVREGFNMYLTEEMTLSANEALPGASIQMQGGGIANGSYDTFYGYITAVLISTDGEEVPLAGETAKSGLSFCRIWSVFDLKATVPDDCPAGNYRLELRSRRNGTDKVAKVYASSYPTVKVLAAGDPDQVRIGAAELEVTDNPSVPNTFRLRAYMVTNLADEAFIGHARPVVADEAGTPVAQAGDEQPIESIAAQGLLSDPVSLTCSVPAGLPNGDYKLCVGVKGMGGSDYLLVEYYDLFYPEKNREEPISLPMTVFDDYVVVNGKRFARDNETGIRPAANGAGSDFSVTDDGSALIVRNKSGHALCFLVCNALGQRLDSFVLDGGATKSLNLPKGFYLVGTEGDVRKIRKK